MNNKLTVAVALVAGLAGGLLTRYLAPAPVFAQAPQVLAPNAPAPAQVPNELRARSFTLVDKNNLVAGTFTTEPGGASRVHIVLRDANGNPIWSAGGNTLRPLSENFK